MKLVQKKAVGKGAGKIGEKDQNKTKRGESELGTHLPYNKKGLLRH